MIDYGKKLLIPQEVNNHDTTSIDSVAMCMNNLCAQGATPCSNIWSFITNCITKNNTALATAKFLVEFFPLLMIGKIAFIADIGGL